ncbi:hypothetical protein ENBRE01_1974 [Enteropsectra breve]|nr:hypothetical protein ENBRE01_1974 [Enteropsectra breve]
MSKFSVKLKVIAVGLVFLIVFIYLARGSTSQKEVSIFAYVNSTVIDSASNKTKNHYRRQPYRMITHSLEDDNFTAEEKKAKIEAQKEVMEQLCSLCRNPIHTKLFPVSMTLEKNMGITDYLYEYEIVNSFDFHFKQCSWKCETFHKYCYSKRYCSRNESGYFYEQDTNRCSVCSCFMSGEYFTETALVCLYKSTKPYEFAYIYKALKKYDGGDISACLGRTAAPAANAQKIKTKVEKCQFKGKNSILASLDFCMLDENSKNRVDVLSRLLRFALSDSTLDKLVFWRSFAATCKDLYETRQCLQHAVDIISEENAVRERVFVSSLLYAYFSYFNRHEIMQLVSKAILSNQYFLLSYLEQSLSVEQAQLFSYFNSSLNMPRG